MKAPYLFEKPAYSSLRNYSFQDKFGTRYSVQFVNHSHSSQHVFVDFSVLDYDDAYATTNRGDVFGVLATVVAIIKDYLDAHPHIIELSANALAELDGKANRRKLLYERMVKREDYFKSWKFTQNDDSLHLKRD